MHRQHQLIRTLCALLVGGSLAVVPPAHAGGPSYRGGCHFMTTNEPTPGPIIDNDYHARAYLAIRPRDDGLPASATAWCDFKVNGVSQGPVAGPVSGYGLLVAAGEFWYSPAEFLEICEHVVIGATELVGCHPSKTTTISLDPVVDLLNETVLYPLDPAICAVLGGDTYLPEYGLFWDCLPYEE